MRVPKWAFGLLLGWLGFTAVAERSGARGQAPENAATSGQGPLHVSGGVIAGNLIHKVFPVYPKCLGPTPISGTTVFHAIIGEDGSIKSLDVVSGAEILRQPGLDAVRQWIYRPYLLNGKPISVDTTIMINVQFNGSVRCPVTP